MDKFKISATGLSINYMPEYLAQKLGYFEEVGLEVESYVPSPWTKVLTDIDSGKYHCVVGGIWVPSIYRNRIKNYYAFAKVASRCPLVLVSRKPVEKFKWSDLENKIVLVSGGNGASPGLFLSGCAKEGGADISKINFVHDFSAQMLFELFQGGLGDMVMLKSDLASMLVDLGKGYVAADLTICGGAVPWSVYYALSEMLDLQSNLAGRFTLALQKATTWLLEHDGEHYKDILLANWPKVDITSAIEIVNMFKREGMWDKTVNIKEDELARWEGFMKAGHVVDESIEYRDIVDSRAYEYASSILMI